MTFRSYSAGSIRTPSSLWLILVVAVVVATSAPPRVEAQEDKAAESPKSQAITEEEARKLAETLQTAIQQGDFKVFNESIDWDGILNKATALPKSKEIEKDREKFKQGVVSQFKRNGGLAGSISGMVKQGGAYKLVRINVEDKAPYLIFRLNLNNGGLNYHKMLLARRSTGQVVVEDLYILLSAENLSDVLKRGWLPIAKQLSKSTAEKFLTTTEPLVANLEQVQKMIELAAQQKHVEAVAVYDALPETVRRDKTLLMLRLRSAQAVSEEEYSKAIQDFRKYHPNDVALDFVLIDGYTLLKQYDEALQCVIRVNDSIGGDAGLLVKKSGALLLLNKVPEARKALEEAITREPDYYDAYAQGLDVALADDNSDETVKYLTILETKFKMTFNNLREVEPFAKFVKSEQYRKWAEGRKDQEQK